MNEIWSAGPSWRAIDGAGGGSTVGVWRADRDGRRWVVKRLEPAAGSDVDNPQDFRWWRREVEVVRSEVLADARGLRAPPGRVEEDESGVTLWSPEIIATPIPDQVVANALGRFATLRPEDPGWFSRDKLRDRVELAERAGGIELLEDAKLGPDVQGAARSVWTDRKMILDCLDQLPQVLSHGDALPRNLLRHDGTEVTAIDWSQLGYAPVGADLATFALWVRTPPQDLLRAYADALAVSLPVDRADVRRGLVLTGSLIAISRVIRTASSASSADYRERLVRWLPLLIEAARDLGLTPL